MILIIATVIFFACFFVYNKFGDYTSDGWSIFYYCSLGLYGFLINIYIASREVIKIRKALFYVCAAFWLSVIVFEFIALKVGYTQFIARVNLISSSIVVLIGLLLILIHYVTKFKG